MKSQLTGIIRVGFYACLLSVLGLCVALPEGHAGLLNRIGGSSASSLGMAGAGEASAFHPGAQNVFLNPAGMMTIDGLEIYAGDISLWSDIEYKRDSNLGGGTFDAYKDMFEFPELAVAWRLDDHWIFGAGTWVPLGLAADLHENLAQKFYHHQSEIFIMQGSMAVAYQFNDELSLGASLDLDYSKVSFHIPSQTLTPLGTIWISPTNKADGFDVGASFGALWTPKPWRFGVKYTLPVPVDVDGDTNLSMLKLGKQSFSAVLNVPQRLTAGVAYDINDIWSMAFDVIYTDYGKNNTLVVDYDNPGLPNKNIPLEWGNVWSFRLGNSIKMTEQLTWAQGIGYVLSGAPDKFMMASVPDSSGISVTTGVKYDWNKHLSTYLSADYTWGSRDIGYTTLENRKAPGELNASLFLLGVGVSYKF